jgi:hypothetical protein
VPAGENPPPGAIFYYYLKSPAQAEVKLEILDSHGQVVRSYSSNDKPAPPPATAPFQAYWFQTSEPPSTAAGMHRFVWDLRYASPPVARNPGYSMSTVFGRSVPLEPEGPQALPGKYTLRLTVDNKTALTQPFDLTMDPRVKATSDDLRKQFDVETQLGETLRQADRTMREIHEARSAGLINEQLESTLVGHRSQAGSEQDSRPTMTSVMGSLGQLITAVDSADAAPTRQEIEATNKVLAEWKVLMTQWQAAKPH